MIHIFWDITPCRLVEQLTTSQRKLLPFCLDGNPRRLHPEYEGSKILRCISSELSVAAASVQKTRIFIAITSITSNLIPYILSRPIYDRIHDKMDFQRKRRNNNYGQCGIFINDNVCTKITAFWKITRYVKTGMHSVGTLTQYAIKYCIINLTCFKNNIQNILYTEIISW
jgi:hypothetical protein